MKKIIQVSINFRYNEVKGKDYDYYQEKAFDEIYYGDDVIDNFEVEEITE